MTDDSITKTSGKPVIMTGLRANNDLHLGNFLGGLRPIVDLQERYAGEYQINLFVPDLHSFTTPIDHSLLNDQVMNNLKLFVASGLDLNNPDTFLYRQSYVSAHCELAWILSCFTHMGELSRMTEYKDKVKSSKSVSVGLFNYPVLMAADILLYSAEYVPLGEDQNQHVEITRDIALRLNEKFKERFPKGLLLPPHDISKQLEFTKRQQGVRIRDLQNPDKKMSKSDASGKGVVFLSENPENARKKIMSAATDSSAKVCYDMAKQPGVSNLLQILAYVSGKTLPEVIEKYQGQSQYGILKQDVADTVSSFLTDFQARLSKVNEAQLLAKLETSEKAMNIQANEILLKVQQAVGLRS